VLDLARHVVEGRIAQAEGDHQRAAREFGIAAAIQDSIAYMEPPYWYYPVSQSLGAALLELGRAEEAVQAFEHGLEAFPDNGPSLWGLAQAQRALGLSDAAEATEQRFRAVWADDPDALTLARL
jgi:tetratricopeptide (TPR) repeat protein